MSSTAETGAPSMPGGPLHLFFSELLSSSSNGSHGCFTMDNVPALVLVEDNAKGHGGWAAQDEIPPFRAMRRASSTGSLGINLKNRKARSKRRKAALVGISRWDTGTQSLELQAVPPKILMEPQDDDIEAIQWICARVSAQTMTCTSPNATGTLSRSGSTVSLDEAMDESDASANRWTTGSSSTPATKKDGAAKLPRRKFSAPEESKMSSPVRLRSLSPIRVPVLDHSSSTNKHNYQNILAALEEVNSEVNFFLSSKHLEIAPDLFRTTI
jgi:hypothetical protein